MRKLTKKFIDSLVCPSGKPYMIIFDSEIRGLAVKIYPAANPRPTVYETESKTESKKLPPVKTFIIDYRVSGRQKRLTVGKYPTITLDKARQLARKMMTGLIEGIDPAETRRNRIKGNTIADLCREYLEKHSRIHKRSTSEDARRIQKYILPSFGKLRIASITQTDMVSFHNKIGEEHSFEANRLLSLLSGMFNFAVKAGMVPAGFANPCRFVQKFDEQPRGRWLNPNELTRLIEEINVEEDIYLRGYLLVLILTGLRKSELLTAKWECVDWDRKELRLPETKSGKIYIQPLSIAAVEILKSLPRMEGNPYIFCGAKPGQHWIGIQKRFEAIRRRAGLEDCRLHDIRRTVGSWLLNDDTHLAIVQAVLHHSDPGVTKKVYAHLSESPIRKALEGYSEKIVSLTKIREGKKESA